MSQFTKSMRNHPSGSAILTTIFLLFGILVVSMIGIQIVMNGLAARRAQGASSKAFYASEAGLERALNLYKNGLDKKSGCSDGKVNYISFGSTDCASDDSNPINYGVNKGDNFGSDSAGTYKVRESNVDRTISLNSRGTYVGTNREIYVSFCLPDCSGGDTTYDGCGRCCGGICI